MNGYINYKRIAEFLHAREHQAYLHDDFELFFRIHEKLNRVFQAWRKATSR